MKWLARLNRRFLLRYRLEYFGVASVFYLVRGLSPRFAWYLARGAGRLAWTLRIRRKTVLTNISVAFPDMEPRERENLARRSYEHFASVAVDMIFQRRLIRPYNFDKHFTFRGWAERYVAEHGTEALRDRARRILFLTGHFGNWELSSGCFSLMGVRIAPVYRMPQNPWVAKLLMRTRLDSQTKFIERRGAVDVMMKHLDRGGNVGFLFDQAAVYGLPVPFFGQVAPMHKTPAVVSRDHDVRIFFGVFVRLGDFLRYEGRGELLELPQRTDDRHADLIRIMTDLARRMEVEVRRNPEQYLWMHRRWKRVGVYQQHGAAK